MDPFALFPIVFIGFFVVVIGGILYAAGRGVGQWVSDNGQPILTAPARIVAKRTEISGGGQRRAWTDHYATFELRDGSRQEFGIGGGEYGLLAEDRKSVV